ncbi:unnamed protein product, partial [Adineta steineri]
MSSTEYILQQIIYQMTQGALPFILLLIGTSNSMGNLITFTSKQLRSNSCGFYILCMTIFELLTISFGLISRIADQYGSTLVNQSRMYCKIRSYFVLCFPTTATYLLLMAAIDRYISTFVSVRCRAFIQLKVAHRMAPLVIILCMVICSHTLIFVDHQPTCGPQLGSYGLFYSVFLIVIGGVLPNFLLVLFGFWTIRNVKASRRRVVALQYLQHKQKRDAQLVLMIFAQAIVSFLLNSTRMSCYSYHLLTTNRPNSSFQQTVDNFLVQFSIVLAYTNYSESFYINTLM